MQTQKAEKLNIVVLRALLGLRRELEFVEALRHYLHEHMETHLHADRLGEFQGPDDLPLRASNPKGDLNQQGIFFLAASRNHGDNYYVLWGINRDGNWVTVHVYYKDQPDNYTPTKVSLDSIDDKALLQIATAREIISALCIEINGYGAHTDPIESVVDKRELSFKRVVSLGDSLSLMNTIAKETFPDSRGD